LSLSLRCCLKLDKRACEGHGAIPSQIAEKFSADWIRLNSRVESLHENEIMLAGGKHAIASHRGGHRRPVSGASGRRASQRSRSVSCFYYAAEEAPVPQPMLTLNGDGAGPVNNFCGDEPGGAVYAPPAKHLISVSVLGTQELTEAQLSGFVIAQMKNWFGWSRVPGGF